MNNEHMNKQIKESAECGAKLDFADLLRRIEADGGRSTAPQMNGKSSAGKVIGIAAGLVAVTTLSAATLMLVGSGKSYAPEAMDAEAPSSEYFSDDFYSQTEMFTNSAVDNNAGLNEAPSAPESAVDVSDGDVSDSDVSGSDVSGTDTEGDE